MTEAERAAALALAQRRVNISVFATPSALNDELEALARALLSEHERAEEAQRKFHEMLEAEHSLSDAYVRLRAIIPGALDNFSRLEPGQLWQHVEAKAKELVERAEALEKRVKELEGRLAGADALLILGWTLDDAIREHEFDNIGDLARAAIARHRLRQEGK